MDIIVRYRLASNSLLEPNKKYNNKIRFQNSIVYHVGDSQLRVDHERPARGVGEDGGVLRAHGVGGQTLVVPRGNLRVVCQHGQWVQALSSLNFRLEFFKRL